MSRWWLCLCRWSRLHSLKEFGLDRLRYAYPQHPKPRPVAPLETMEPRMLFSSSILGSVFADGDQDGVRGEIAPAAYEREQFIQQEEGKGRSLSKSAADAELKKNLGKEKSLQGWSVYLDENLDGQYNPGERQAKTSRTGEFRFEGLSRGTHDIGLIAEEGWRFTEETNPIQTIAVDGESDSSIDFAVVRDIQAAIEVKKAKKNQIGGSVTLDLRTLGLPKGAEFMIDWGDGTTEKYDKNSKKLRHDYALDGLFDIRVVTADETGRHQIEPIYAEVGDTSRGLYQADDGQYEFDDVPWVINDRIERGITGRDGSADLASRVETPENLSLSTLSKNAATFGDGLALASLSGGAMAAQSTSGGTSAAVSGPVELIPLGDAYVRDGSYSTDVYGFSNRMIVKNSTSPYNREAFLRFDVSALENTPNATLRLMTTGMNTGGDTANIMLHVVDDDSWEEYKLNWNTRPSVTGGVVAQATGAQIGTAMDFDITAAVQAAAAGDGILTLRASTDTWNIGVDFASRDHADSNLRPKLIATAEVPELSINTPASISAGVAGTYTFTASGSARPDTEWLIDWGDGSNLEAAIGASVTLSHTFSGTASSYDIRAIANDPRQGRRLPGDVRYDSLVMSENPVTYWRLSEAPTATVTVDEAGAIDGTYTTRPAGHYAAGLQPSLGQVSWLHGDPNASVDLNPAYSRVLHDSALLLDNGTISFWMNDENGVRDRGLVSKDKSGFGTGGHFGLFAKPDTGTGDDDGYIQVRLQESDGSGGGTSHTIGSPADNDIDEDRWHHVAFSWGNQGMKLYVDGQQVASDPYTGGLGATSGGAGNFEDLILGAHSGWSTSSYLEGIGNSFSGMLDEVAVFDSQLSQDAILDQFFAESVTATVSLATAGNPVTLTEDADLITTNKTEPNGFDAVFTVPANPDGLRVDFTDLQFDNSGGNPGDVNDAFEILLIDLATGESVVSTIGPGRQAFFNYSQGQAPLAAAGVALLDNADNLVTLTPGSDPLLGAGGVILDISGLTPGQEVELIARLVNNDDDNATQVTVDFNFTGGGTPATVVTTQLPPAHDVYIRGGSNANNNYSSSDTLLLKQDPNSTYDREGLLAFDLAGLNGGTIQSAKLELTVSSVGTSPILNTRLRTTATGWDENTVTWNSRPTAGPDVATWATPPVGQTQSIDVTAEITAALASGEVSFALDILDSPNSQRWVRYGAKENADPNLRPRLVIETLTAGTPGSSGTPGNVAFPAGAQANQAAAPPRSATYAAQIDFEDLSDVTGAFTVEYEHTAFDSDSDELYTGLSVSKAGVQEIRGSVLLAITNLDQAGTEWLNFDSVASGLPGFEGINTPYIDITHLLEQNADGFTVDSAAVDNLLLQFENPGGERFDFDVAIFSQLNQPPVFVTSPFLPGQDTVTVRQGNTFAYDALAEDPDNDTVSYSLGDGAPAGVNVDSATGQITWDTTAVAEGGYVLTVIADDGFGGVATQRVPINVLITTQNLPPQFTTDPVTVAYAGVEYVYDADAIDPESDTLVYTGTAQYDDNGTPVVIEPNEFMVASDSAVVTWTPGDSLIGQTVAVTLITDDGNGGTDTQPYDILVLEGPRPFEPGVPDLTVSAVDASGIDFNGQNLLVQGIVTADVTNLGDGSVNEPFTVRFFEDLDFDQTYTPGVDRALGETVVDQPLLKNQVITVAAEITGSVSYAGAIIRAWVDSGETILEANEANNIAGSRDDCQVTPIPGSFNPVIEWQRTAANRPFSILPQYNIVYSTPTAADINNDGIADVVVPTGNTSDGGLGPVRAFDGASGDELWQFPSSQYAGTVYDSNNFVSTDNGVALADIDNDGFIEIIAIDQNGSFQGGEIRVFDHTGRVESFWQTTYLPRIDYWSYPAVADLDANGTIEIVVGAYTLDNQGAVVGELPSNVAPSSIPIISDLDNDGISEIIHGSRVFTPTGTAKTGWNPAALLSGNSITSALADFDGDGSPEVVVVDGGFSSRLYLLNHDGSPYNANWSSGINIGDRGGAPTIADFNGDGSIEIGIATGSKYVIVDDQGVIRWDYSTVDGSSAVTGSTVFDFEGDGRAEVVYRDERFLYIFRVPEDDTQSTLEVAYQENFTSTNQDISITGREAPIVIDVDGDGNAEIVVPLDEGNPGIYVIGDLNDSWVPTREIWNQHSYHITNINDDGTVPINEAPSWLSHNTYRLNTITDPDFSPLDAPDLIPSYLRINESSSDSTYTVRVGNSGSFFAAAGVSVAFYDGDPSSGGTLLGTSVTTTRLNPDEYEDVSLAVAGSAIADLWVVADDDGAGNGSVRECNETNNAYSLIEGNTPLPPNTEPTINSSAIRTVIVGQDYVYDVEASDADTGQRLAYELAVAPAGMTIDAVSGLINWTPSIDDLGAKQVVVRVSDGYGGSDLQSYLLNVISDNEPPQIISSSDDGQFVAGDWQYRVEATDPNGDPLTYRVVDDAGLSAAFSTTPGNENLLVVANPADGAYVIEIEVSDGRGGSDTQRFSVTFTANKPPVFNTEPSTLYSLGDNGGEYTYALNITDPDVGDTVTLSLDAASRARGMTLDDPADPTTTLRWSPSVAGDYGVRVTAEDSVGNLRTLTYTLRVVDPAAANEGATITSNATGPAVVDRTWSYLVTTDDANGDPVTVTLESFVDAQGNDLSSQVTTNVSTAGQLLIQWTPTTAVEGPVSIEVKAVDSSSEGETQSFDLPVLDNAPPIVGNPSFPSASVGVAYSHDFQVSDPNPGDTLTYEIVSGGQPGMTFVGGVLAWSSPVLPTSGNTYDLVLRVSDDGDPEAAVDLTVSLPVYDTSTNVLPTILSKDLSTGEAYARTQVAAEAVFQHQVVAEDPNGDDLTYALVGAPSGMSIDSRGLITWRPTVDDLDTANGNADQLYTFSVTVSDDAGITVGDIASFNLTVTRESINNAPTITSTPAGGVALGAVYTYQATADDPDNDALAWALVDGPDGAEIDPDTGRLTWTPTPGQLGPQALTVRVLDAYGLGETQTFTVEVRATNLPPRIGFSAPTQAYVGQSDYQFVVQAVDPEGTEVSLAVTDEFDTPIPWLDGLTDNGDGTWLVSSASVGAAGSYTVKLTATDGAGQTDTQSFTLNVTSVAVNLPLELVDVDRNPGPDPYDPAGPGSISTLPVAVGELYTYTVEFSDPNGDPIDFALGSGSTLVQDFSNIADPAVGQVSLEDVGDSVLVRWRPSAAQIGQSHLINIQASDGQYSMTIPLSAVVRGNTAPTLSPLSDSDAAVGGEMRVQAYANDPERGALAFALVDGVDPVPVGMSIDAVTGLITWSPTVADLDAGQPKSYTVNVVATDTLGAASSPQSLTVTVAQDTTAPQVVVRTNNSAPAQGLTIVLTVDATDASGIAARWLTINGQQTQIDANGQATYTVTDANPVVAQGFARDANGFDGSSDVLTITPYTASEVPNISVTGPTQDVPVEQYVEITGVIDDPDFVGNGGAGDTVNYRAYLIHAATGETLLLGEGATSQRIDGEIGIAVDPTLIANGSYVIRLQASNAADLDAPGAAPVLQLDTWIEIDSDVSKVGNFALSFTDLSTSVGGIPIVVTRSYDTIDAQEDGDFGYGWSLDIATGGVEVSNLGYSELVAFGGTAFTEQPYQYGTRLDFTLPGGQEMGFTAVPNSYSKGGRAGGIFGFAEVFSVAFQPDGDSLGTKLEFIGGESVRLDNENADAFGLENGTAIKSVAVVSDGISLNQPGIGASSGAGLPFNPITAGWDFRLTTQDGAQYTYDSKTGRLLNVVDREGNRLSFDSNSQGDVITSRDESGLILGQVQITRDNQSRVTSITDLEDPEGDQVTYTYDADGNLETVTDRTGVTTTFAYNEQTGLPDHYLTSVTNELGVKVLQAQFFTTDKLDAQYDPELAGRLKGLVDASGAAANFGYTMSGADVGLPGATIESVADANNIPTEVVRDAAGNTIRTIQRIDDPATAGLDYLVSVFEYDADDNQTAAWQPFTHTEPAGGDNSRFTAAPAIKQADTTYDRFGRPETVTDALGNTTTYAYDTFGNPTTIIDALGNVTRNRYDNEGRLSRTEDAEGNVTEYGYDPRGNLKSITQFDDNGDPVPSSTFAYDGKGRLTSTTDVNNVTRYFAYDGDGNQTHSWSFKDNVTTVSVTGYDEEGRGESSAQYTLAGALTTFAAVEAEIANASGPDWSTSTAYDALGRVKTSTDRFGTVTENFYDARGNVAETRTETTLASGTDGFVVTRTAYDTNGRGIASVDPFLMDAAGNVLDPTDESIAGSDRSFIRVTHTLYDDAGRVTETRRVAGEPLTATGPDANGLVSTDFAYDETLDTYAVGTVLSRTYTRYDDAGRVYETETTEGLVTLFTYDDAGRQTKVTLDPADALGMLAETVYTYDALGRQETVADPAGRVTRFIYDSLGRVVRTIQEGNDNDASTDLVTRTVYDALGRRVAEIDALGRRTDFAYDDAGRLTGVTLPGVIDHGPNATTGNELVRPGYTYGYDNYGNQTSITDPIGTSTTSIADDRETTFTYDHLNRQTSRTLPEGMSESMAYYDTDNAAAGEYYGLLKETIDFEGRVTTFIYDDFGRLDTKTYYDSVADQTAGNPARIVNTTYDAFGRTVEVNDSGHGLTATKYDAEGRTVQIDSPEGVLNYEYDDFGRMIRTFTTPTAVSTDAISDTRYSYDEQGRLTGVTMVERNNTAVPGITVAWNGTTITGEHTAYFYDAAGTLERTEQTTNESGTAHTVTSKYTYDALNRLTDIHQFVDGNSNQAADSGEWIASFHYDLDNAGNRTQATERFDLDGDGSFDAGQRNGGVDLLQTFNWIYDGLNRLVEERLDLGSNGTADAEDYITRYLFDLASNRQQLLKDVGNAIAANFSVDESIDYTYDENDRLLTEQQSGNSNEYTEYQYGPNADPVNGYGGDHTTQTRKTVYTDNTKTTKVSDSFYLFDATGRMTEETAEKYVGGTLDSTTITTYTYDDAGLRVREVVNDGTNVNTKTYLFDTRNHTRYAQVFEEYLNDQLVKVATIGHDLLTEATVVEADAGTATGAGDPYTFLYDGHGSTRVLLDAAMNLAEKQDTGNPGILQVFSYDAYGKMLGQTSITVGSKALASEIVDALTSNLYSGEHTNASGVQYLRARWYDPSSGRFNRLDPFAGNMGDPLSLHKYLYTHGNPISGIDPSGLLTFTNVLAGISISSLTAGLVGAGIGVAFDGASGAIRGFTGSFIGTFVGLSLAAAVPIPGIANASLGIGSGIGTAIEIALFDGLDAIYEPENLLIIGISALLGTAFSGGGAASARYVANRVGSKVLSIPRVYSGLQRMIQAARNGGEVSPGYISNLLRGIDDGGGLGTIFKPEVELFGQLKGGLFEFAGILNRSISRDTLKDAILEGSFESLENALQADNGQLVLELGALFIKFVYGEDVRSVADLGDIA